MRMPDVGVLVYAHRADDPSHAFYRDWLERLAAGPEPFALSPLVVGAFVRLVTNARAFPDPTPLPVALATMTTLLSRRSCRFLGPGEAHWDLFARLCTHARATGKLVADAQLAAVAIEHGCTWVTRDRDFSKFQGAGLRWEHLTT